MLVWDGWYFEEKSSGSASSRSPDSDLSEYFGLKKGSKFTVKVKIFPPLQCKVYIALKSKYH